MQERLGEDRLQLVTKARRLGFGGGKVGQQRVRVAVIVGNAVRVPDVEIVAARLHLLSGDTPRLRRLLAALPILAAPPVDALLKVC